MSQNDPQANESHLIGNILAEDNSDSENEDARGGTNYKFGVAFGMGSSIPYGGAFSNNVPGRVGSAPATDPSMNFGNDSPQSKIQQFQFSNPLGPQEYANVGGYVGQHDPSMINDMMRKGPGQEYGQAIAQQPDIGSMQASQFINQQNLSAQNQTAFLQNYGNPASDVLYSSKQYYDYYHSLKPKDPRLPKPTWQPQVDIDSLRGTKQLNKVGMESQAKSGSFQEDFERKMGNLSLEDTQKNPFDYSQQNQQVSHQQKNIQSQPNIYQQFPQMNQIPFQASGSSSQPQYQQQQFQQQQQAYPGFGSNNAQQNQNPQGQNQLGKGKKKSKNNFDPGSQSQPQPQPSQIPPKPKQQIQQTTSYPQTLGYPPLNQQQQQQTPALFRAQSEQTIPTYSGGGYQYPYAAGASQQQYNQSMMQGNSTGNMVYQEYQQSEKQWGGAQGQNMQGQTPYMMQNYGGMGYTQGGQPFNQYMQGQYGYGQGGQYMPMTGGYGNQGYSGQMMYGQNMQMNGGFGMQGGNQKGFGHQKGGGGSKQGGKGFKGGNQSNQNSAPQLGLGNQQMQVVQQPKSPFLEDLRNKIQNGKKIEIKDIKEHVVECAMDQYGSRFIQQKYDVTTPEEKDLIFTEILPEAYNLMNDVFGNYVVQKLFEFGTDQQRSTLADQLFGNVLKLTQSMYGCRVVQKALEVISLDQQKLLVSELKDNVLECINDQNGNHVIQKCIEKMPNDAIDFITQPVTDNVCDLCVHTYGCRVIQRVLENCAEKKTTPILDNILQDIHNLTKDQFGNYVIQHILEHGQNQEDKNKIVKSIKGKVIELSNHKFASNVVEKCLQYGSEKDKKEIIDEFLDSNYEDETGQNLNGALYQMMKDRYGNYVIQKCIEVSKGKQKETLIKKITACANVLRKQANYSRHVYNFIEKMSTESGANSFSQGGGSNHHHHNNNGGGGGGHNQSVNSNEHTNYTYGSNRQYDNLQVDNSGQQQYGNQQNQVYRQQKKKQL